MALERVRTKSQTAEHVMLGTHIVIRDPVRTLIHHEPPTTGYTRAGFSPVEKAVTPRRSSTASHHHEPDGFSRSSRVPASGVPAGVRRG
ncbi:hypothetical protein LZG04_11175 [Saccharothrix sp. S26]|nr:hypothetical protein [Saccharothrix sp. S26]